MFGISVSEPLARKGLSYVPENPYLFDYLTPYETLSMGRSLHGLKKNDLRVNYWLERLELGTVANKPIRGFSKGMTQRTALAHALAVEPRLLILDEPNPGLDPIGASRRGRNTYGLQEVWWHSFYIARAVHDVERLADWTRLIHQGTMRAVRSPAELVGDDDQVVVRSINPIFLEGQRRNSEGVVGTGYRDLWQTLSLKDAGRIIGRSEAYPFIGNSFYEGCFSTIDRKTHCGGLCI